ncbi:hypothetical protein N7532_001722, partial [Penicillium argentinense]
GSKGRRSIHSLSNESIISDERIEEILSEVLTHMTSGFNTQATRMVVFLREQHENSHAVVKATVLFYEDRAPFTLLEAKMPIIKDKFTEWSDHASGMCQLAVWTLLEAEGLGCNLQHYNPMIDAQVSEQWNVPLEWRSKAQVVFGKPAGTPREKTVEPVSGRLFIHGK